jgi:hypothetical protein
MTNFNRAENFIRVTEVRPFTQTHKITLINYIKSMLEQISIHRTAQPSNRNERVIIAEKLFQTLMDYPEFLSTYPKFRITVNNKIHEIINDIKFYNLPESTLINDAMYYMKMLSARPDFIEYNCFIHGFTNPILPPLAVLAPLTALAPLPPTIPDVLEKFISKGHSYNLRPRNKRMRYAY